MWENVRERIASQLAESAIRGTGSVTCRVAYLAPVEVPTDKVMWLLSSNKASMTSDLAARALNYPAAQTARYLHVPKIRR
jgi:hypothetical protein